jgi:hypothetical protein
MRRIIGSKVRTAIVCARQGLSAPQMIAGSILLWPRNGLLSTTTRATPKADRCHMDQDNLQAEALRRVPTLRNDTAATKSSRMIRRSSECWLPRPQGATTPSAWRCGAVLGSSTCGALPNVITGPQSARRQGACRSTCGRLDRPASKTRRAKHKKLTSAGKPAKVAPIRRHAKADRSRQRPLEGQSKLVAKIRLIKTDTLAREAGKADRSDRRPEAGRPKVPTLFRPQYQRLYEFARW